MSEQTAAHRWSGWPGAWCLDCGMDDQYEIALADGRINTDGVDVWWVDPSEEARVRAMMICPESGSKRHDPYARAAERATLQGKKP